MAVATEINRRMRAHSRLAGEKAYRLMIQTRNTVTSSAETVAREAPLEKTSSRRRLSRRRRYALS